MPLIYAAFHISKQMWKESCTILVFLRLYVRKLPRTYSSGEQHLGLVDSPNEDVFRGNLDMLKLRGNELEEKNRTSVKT
jgi:hypothetical protein